MNRLGSGPKRTRPPRHQQPVGSGLINLRDSDRSVTYQVDCLLILVALLVGGGLGLIWATLLVVQGLPSLTKDLSDLA